MNKVLAILAAAVMVLTTACGNAASSSGGSIISGSGTVTFESSSMGDSEILPPPPESPSAVPESSSSSTTNKPAPSSSSSTSSSTPSSSGSSASSSKVTSSSSSSSPSSLSSKPSTSSSTASSSSSSSSSQSSNDSIQTGAGVTPDEVRSIWISYLEFGNLLMGKSATQFRNNIVKVFDNCSKFGLNTVIVQVRPFGDAIYPSDYFPQSYLFTGKEGGVGEAPFDALQIMIDEAKKRDLRIEAWINPYRVRKDASRALSADNPVHAMLQSGDAVKMGDVITYNPASEKAQNLIVAGVEELVENYDLDAIHFDDYFYPTTSDSFDKAHYADYKSSGGTKSLAAWRRSNVTTLVRKVRNAIRAIDPDVLFGISPQGNMSNNLNSQYVDVEEIISLNLIDYICPQMYFGFDNTGCPYKETIADFNRMTAGTNVKVYVGLATYKFGKTDEWAGAGKNEWKNTTDIVARQVQCARDLSRYGGFVLYRYDSTFEYQSFYASMSSVWNQVETELANLKKLL